MTDPRRTLLHAYRAALAAVDGRTRVRDFLAARTPERRRVVAIGKAAAAMTLGALDTGGVESALVITKHGHDAPALRGRVTVMEAGHPLPDEASLAAGEALFEFIRSAPAEQPFLFLLSGGASALVEALPEGVTLADLVRVNTHLLGAGLDIAVMNQVRKRLSRIKQGRLARALAGRPTLCLLISDVPGDDPSVIGSGPLVPDPHAHLPLPPVPADISALLADTEPPAPDDPCFHTIETHVIASNRDARAAAARAASEAGISVIAHDDLLTGDVAEVARHVTDTLLASGPALHVWGGEPTVRLPPAPGRGGRCQHLALLIAARIAGRDDISVLAAGTDGSDGPGEDAGALVDGHTVERGEDEGYRLVEVIARADAGSFLEASGDLITTGPTGTNVMDLVFGLKV
ncbi:MAG: glycerate kinase [Thiohalomonadaceae bacterium]